MADTDNKTAAQNNRLLKAVVGLLAAQNASQERIELVLAAYGLTYVDIAEVLGKKPDAVRMLLKRNKVKG